MNKQFKLKNGKLADIAPTILDTYVSSNIANKL